MVFGPTAALATAVEGLLVLDRAGTFTYANPAAERILGAPAAQIVGSSPDRWRMHGRCGRPMTTDELPATRLLRTGEPSASAEHVIERADGSEAVVLHTATLARDDRGLIEGAVISLLDLTERDGVANGPIQRELDDTVSLLRATLDSTADGLLVVDARGRVTAYNDKFREMWRIPAAILESRDDRRAIDFVLDQLRDPEGFLRGTAALYEDPEATSYDVLELTDGRTYERYSQPQRLLGRCLGRVWSFRDVSERRRAEVDREQMLAEQVAAREEMEALAVVAQRQAAELQHIHGSMSDSVIACDARGVVTHVNEAEARLAGVRINDVIGRCLADYAAMLGLRHMDDRPVEVNELALARALEGETVTSATFRSERAGRKIYLRASASPIRDANGTITGAVAVEHDVSSMIEFDMLKDQFIRVAAHELKTPVAIMKGYADLLLRSAEPLPPALAGSLEAIERGARRIDRLVADLLDVSQLQLGRMEIRRDKVDLSELVEVVARRVGSKSKTHDIRIAESEPVVVQADRIRLERVLDKLLDNAVRYSPRGGPIEVSTRVHDDAAVVCVCDHGVGIAREKQERIFERFYRAHTDTPHDYGGMGVGLYISREIIAQHGGTMWFQSHHCRGSKFCFSLPVKT